MAEVTCNYCGQVGEVYVLGISEDLEEGKLQVDDRIPHLDSCELMRRRKPKRQPRHLAAKRWKKQEREVAKLTGSGLTPASGALNEDGDARSMHGVRVECKQTDSSVYRLDQRTWSKLVRGARSAGEIPVLQVQLFYKGAPWTIYVVPHGDLALGPKEMTIPGSTTRIAISRGLESYTPFYVKDILDPEPVFLTEHELTEALNAALD